jgi:hypothetical protein
MKNKGWWKVSIHMIEMVITDGFDNSDTRIVDEGSHLVSHGFALMSHAVWRL